MASPFYTAALAGLTHRLRLIGVDIDYTQAGKTRRMRGIINGAQEGRDLSSGGYDQEFSSTLRLARVRGFTPKIGDTVTISAGTTYRIGSVGDIPQSPEWRLGLEPVTN